MSNRNTAEMEFHNHLTQIVAEAIISHWDLLTPSLQVIVTETVRDRRFQIEYAIGDAIVNGIKLATNKKMADFGVILEQMAEEETRKALARRLKARKMSTDILDSIPQKGTE